jgi:addiction module antitoxin, relB/dinJ family
MSIIFLNSQQKSSMTIFFFFFALLLHYIRICDIIKAEQNRKETSRMANMVNFSIRVNPKVRDEANALFESLGLDLATATRIFYQAALNCGGFPFEVKKEIPNEETIKALQDADRGIGMSEPFDTVAELMEWLYADN